MDKKVPLLGQLHEPHGLARLLVETTGLRIMVKRFDLYS